MIRKSWAFFLFKTLDFFTEFCAHKYFRCTLKMGVSGEIDLDKLFEHLGPDILLNTQNQQNNEGVDNVFGNFSSLLSIIQGVDTSAEGKYDVIQNSVRY